MTARPKSYRLTDEDLARLKRLARPGESDASVLRRALVALERGQEDAPAVSQYPSLAKRMDALEERLAALVMSNTEVTHSEPAPRVTSVLPSHTPPPPAPLPRPSQADSTPSPTAAKSPHSRPDYPPEVRRMAVELSDSGIAPAQIRQRIIEVVGRAPDSKNWGKVIRIWRERLNS